MTTTSIPVREIRAGDRLLWQHDELVVHVVTVLVTGVVVRSGERHRLQYDRGEFVTVTRPEG